MIRNLGKEKSIMNRFLAELRDEVIQKDPMRFRRNLERMGEVFAFEISKELAYGLQEVVTSLGVAEMELPLEEPVIATILRAGIPFHQGFLNYFDRAPSAFISCYRKHTTGNNFEIQLSLYLTYRELKQFGSPKHIHIVSVISSMEGINYLRRNLPLNDVTIWTAAIDEELTARSYIVPGLGDAGDLAYGKKTTAE
ncbi:MAG: uracil phosphoribosyltransferase [Bacteroidetes bacterium]|nr:MAG: uracil phosphoribosyltransferase [Bacteroidota bacterium]